VEQYAKARGMAVTRSAPYTPQSNGIAERMNRTLVEAVRTTLAQSGRPKVFWAESLANAVMVRNRMPRDNGVGPYEQIRGHQHTLERYRPFCCLGMVHLHESKGKKLDAKTIPCVLLRTIDHITYRMYDIAKGQVVMTRHVIFDESKFPAKEQPTSLNDSDKQISSETPSEHNADNESVYGNPGSDSSGTPKVEEAASVNSDTSEDNASVSDEAARQAENETSTNNDVGEIDITRDDQRRYPARNRRPPTSWWASMTAAADKCHGPTIVPEEHNACHTAKTAANDSPTLKEAPTRCT
jgi:hypothetical protein